MNTLRDYVEWKLTHSEKTAEAEGYPLVLENCKSGKKMKELKVYGNSVQYGTPSPDNPIEVLSVGNLVTDESDVNFGKYKIPIVQDSLDIKNNFVVEGAFSNNINCLYNDGVYTFTRTEAPPNRFSEIFYVNIPAGDLYLRYDVMETTCTRPLLLYIYFADGTTTTPGFYPYDSTYAFKVDKDIVRMRIYLDANEPVGAYIKFKHLAICRNALPLLTKQTHNLYLDEPLRKIGNYADHIDFKNQKVVRNVYENVLSSVDRNKYNVGMLDIGVPAIRFMYTAAYLQYYLPTSGGLQVSYYALCNRYPVVTAGKRGDITVSGSTSAMNLFDIADSDYTTLDEWDAYLQRLYNEGTPLKLIHAIRNPIEEDISCQLPKITEKTTVFTVDSDIVPSNMYGKYIK